MDKFVNLNIDPNQKIYFNFPKLVSVFFLFNNKNQVLMILTCYSINVFICFKNNKLLIYILRTHSLNIISQRPIPKEK